MAFSTPILLILYNRPATTRQVFDSVRRLKPAVLYVAADGPKPGREGDRERCLEAREVVSGGIDWDCRVRTLLREENLGCGKGVSSAIDWFFGEEEEGIILEDDILPGPGFFQYARELLDRYREDERVMMITGFNHQQEWPANGSYFFAYYGSVWGWATWKRAWDTYDFSLKAWDSIKRRHLLKKVLQQDDHYIGYREMLVDKVAGGTLDTWDYQWGVARIVHSGLSIIPGQSLVTNIGFGQDATHTRDPSSTLANTPPGSLRFPLEHNPAVVPDREYDNAFMRSIAGPPPDSVPDSAPKARILFITHYTKLYGANLSLMDLIFQLEPPFEPHVLCPSGGDLVDALRGKGVACHIRRFGISFTPNRPSLRKCIRRMRYLPRMILLVRRIKPAVIYSNTSVIDYGAWLGVLTGRPHIWHFREFGQQDYGIHYDGGERLYRFLLRRAGERVAVSGSIREKVLGGMPSRLVYNGIAPEKSIPGEGRKVRGAPKFALVGHLHPAKGHETAIRAFSKYVADNGTGTLAIVGSGDEAYEAELRRLVYELGLQDQVRFAGYVPDREQVYRETDILLMCSAHEAFGRVTAEAMARGIPVIGYDAGGTREIVSHGENGWLYRDEPGLLRGMFELTSPGGPYAKMSRMALETVREKFTVEKYAAAIAGILRDAAIP